METRRLIVSFICALFVLGSSAAFGIPIDRYTDPFPSNPDLPGSLQPILFVGTVYDPLNAYIAHLGTDGCHQTDLAGVLGSDRQVELSYVSGTATAMVLNGLWLANSAGARSILEVRYGVTANLDVDLTVYAGTQLEIEVIDGDMADGPRPVPCTITVTSRKGSPYEATGSFTRELTGTGTFEFPFADFSGDVNFRHVDEIVIIFDASGVSAVDLAVGSFETNGDPVPVAPATWGQIKSLWE